MEWGLVGGLAIALGAVITMAAYIHRAGRARLAQERAQNEHAWEVHRHAETRTVLAQRTSEVSTVQEIADELREQVAERDAEIDTLIDKLPPSDRAAHARRGRLDLVRRIEADDHPDPDDAA